MTANIYAPKSWEEQTVSGDDDQPRFAHVHAIFEYSGEITGTSVCDFLLYYAGEGYDGGDRTSPGYERFEGSVDGRKGSYVARHEVRYDAKSIHDSWTVVAGSGTGELAGLSGSGSASAAMGEPSVSYAVHYSFA